MGVRQICRWEEVAEHWSVRISGTAGEQVMRRTILGNWMWVGMWAAYLGLAIIGFIAGCSAMQQSAH